MKTIDATKKLTIRHFKNLKSNLKDEEMLLILVDNEEIGNISKENFQDVFSTNMLSDLEDEQIITFFAENVMMSITAKDYKKWTNPWWCARIFADETKQIKIEPLAICINCEVYKQRKSDKSKYDVVSFQSEKMKDVVNFINSVRPKMQIQSVLEDAEVIFKLWYGSESDAEVTGTFDELSEKGVFVQ